MTLPATEAEPATTALMPSSLMLSRKDNQDLCATLNQHSLDVKGPDTFTERRSFSLIAMSIRNPKMAAAIVDMKAHSLLTLLNLVIHSLGTFIGGGGVFHIHDQCIAMMREYAFGPPQVKLKRPHLETSSFKEQVKLRSNPRCLLGRGTVWAFVASPRSG